MPTIYDVREINPFLFTSDVVNLYQQLTPEKRMELPDDFLLKQKPLYPSHFRMFGALDVTDKNKPQRVVSMATLSFVSTGEKNFGQIHDVVTDKAHRGKQCGRDMSLAEEILRMVIDYAHVRELSHLELTSKPDREAANALYQKIGFRIVSKAVPGGTNLYRLRP